jgi:hypothetical protein
MIYNHNKNLQTQGLFFIIRFTEKNPKPLPESLRLWIFILFYTLGNEGKVSFKQL